MTVYFITCHHSPDFVRDQFRFLYNSDDVFLYHVDTKASAALHETVRRLAQAYANVAVLPSRHYAWAAYSQVSTTLDAIAWALDRLPAWSHFVAISEQHCPLLTPDAMRAALRPDLSLVEMTPFSAMSAGSRRDLTHRSSMDYRELPGVGSFGVAVQAPDPAFLARLCHGSNWYVLSAKACTFLRAALPDWPDAHRFRHSVHPDEDMLQTLLSQAGERAGTIELRETTFVAWPHIIGNDSMIFREQDFFDAQAKGWLFIRKRPTELPERVATALEASAALSESALSEAIGPPLDTVPVMPDPDGLAMARRVRRIVVRRGRGILSDLPNLRYGRRDPLFSLVFQSDRAPLDVEIRVVSQNLTDFRVLLISTEPPAIDFKERYIHGRLAPLLRVRSENLMFRQEILVPEDLAHGFWTLPSDGSIAGLVRRIEFYLRVAESLGDHDVPVPATGTFAPVLREAAARWRSVSWTVRRFASRKLRIRPNAQHKR